MCLHAGCVCPWMCLHAGYVWLMYAHKCVCMQAMYDWYLPIHVFACRLCMPIHVFACRLCMTDICPWMCLHAGCVCWFVSVFMQKVYAGLVSVHTYMDVLILNIFLRGAWQGILWKDGYKVKRQKEFSLYCYAVSPNRDKRVCLQFPISVAYCI